ncbi:GNAT family N-acetyltransferase [Streptacidiphilus sp. PAMC 29251]
MDASRSPAVLRRYGPSDVPALLDTLVEVWADAHAGHRDVAEADLTPEALHQQLTAHAKRPGFTLIAAYDAGVLVGFGYAFPCTPAYWFGTELLPQIPEAARSTEHLVGLCELAVRPSWQDRGIGSRLHHALVEALASRYISLLAMPGNADSQRLYRRTGCR